MKNRCKHQVVAFCGKMGSGKDTLGEYYAKQTGRKDLIHYSFADPLKEEVNDIVEEVKNGISTYALSYLTNTTLEEASTIFQLVNKELAKDKKVTSRSRTKGMRYILQYWGTDVRRKQDNDYWVKLAKERLTEMVSKGKYVYITDARFLNELACVKEDLGGYTVYLSVPDYVRVQRIQERDGITPTMAALTHQSETESSLYEHYDMIVRVERSDTIKDTFDKMKGGLLI